MNNFFKRATELMPNMLKDRHYLHENAECGSHLPNTTAYIIKRLKQIGLDPEEICDSGVTATIYGEKPGKTILLRCDTDALPMSETNDLLFKSKTNAAHNCGHDIHTSMLLSAAQLLKESSKELVGNVKLMFQPAEEIFQGSQNMIKSGVLKNPSVDAAIGIHTMLDYDAPSVAFCEGNMTSSCDGFKITITGKGCHGALPHSGIDPINAGVHIYLSFQELIARETPSMETASLTLGQFSAGNSPNIIPNIATLQGTLRTYNTEVRNKLFSRIQDIIKSTELMCNVKIQYEVLSSVPSTYTDPTLLKELVSYVEDIDENMKYIPNYRVTPSDDLAFISKEVPTVYFMLGCHVPGNDYPHHNPNVLFDENAMAYGASIYSTCAFNWLNNNN